jgi:FAD:protein FMN transferase
MDDKSFTFKSRDDVWLTNFKAFAGPCEIQFCQQKRSLALELSMAVIAEVRRIENKFSRYLPDSSISQINLSRGARFALDPETARLLEFANKCWQLSSGMFDISSGILGRIWKFETSATPPARELIKSCLKNIGWHKIKLDFAQDKSVAQYITLPDGMSLDLGGIGKEYAVDCCHTILAAESSCSALVNFGGDLRIVGRRPDESPWRITIEDPRCAGQSTAEMIAMHTGALATSGDTKRFFDWQGKRYSHIFNPKTGWPIQGAPRSVTVLDESCSQAGMLSTFAILYGLNAEEFLKREGAKSWCTRH